MKKLLLVATALIISAPAYATDGFGDRFGSNAPYALSDGMDNAVADTQGFGMDDMNDPSALNQIDPAAGEEEAQAQEAELEAAAENEDDTATVDQDNEEAASEVETATEAQPETGSAKIEPAAGAATAANAQKETETGLSADVDANTDVVAPVED